MLWCVGREGGRGVAWQGIEKFEKGGSALAHVSYGRSIEDGKRAAKALSEHQVSHKIDMAAKTQHMKNPTFTLHCPFRKI